MRYPRSLIIIVVIFTLYFLFFNIQNVYAYLDLGSGSYVFQLVISVLIGVAFAIKIYWKKFRVILLNIFSKKRKDNG
jgi:hypothetical protein